MKEEFPETGEKYTGAGAMKRGEELVSPRLTPGELAALQRPLELDLMAAYSVIRDEVLAELRRVACGGGTSEDFMAALDDLLGEPDWLSAEELGG